MPKALFYTGTAFCLFLALTSAVESSRELQTGAVSLIALHGREARANEVVPKVE